MISTVPHGAFLQLGQALHTSARFQAGPAAAGLSTHPRNASASAPLLAAQPPVSRPS